MLISFLQKGDWQGAWYALANMLEICSAWCCKLLCRSDDRHDHVRVARMTN